MGNSFNITPDYQTLFKVFEKEARHRASCLSRELPPATHDSLEAFHEQRVGILRIIQGLIQPLAMCAYSATSSADVERFRELISNVLELVVTQADQQEADIAGTEKKVNIEPEHPDTCDQCGQPLLERTVAAGYSIYCSHACAETGK